LLTGTGPSIVIPIGCWTVYWEAIGNWNGASAVGQEVAMTLSTANNTESDTGFTSRVFLANLISTWVTQRRQKVVNLAAKATYYLNINAKQGGSPSSSLEIRGDVVPSIIRAVCAYL
jgi:ribosomal protein L28